MLDDRTKAMMNMIGLDVDAAGKARMKQSAPELHAEPEPEPCLEHVAAGSYTFPACGDQADARPHASEVVQLEESYLTAVVTAQQLAQQMLEMTNRWVALMDD